MNTPTFWGVVCTLAIVAALLHAGAPAQAATPTAPTPISDNCEAVATVGLLEVVFCETPYGDLFVNSFGFMTVVE